MDSTIRVLTTDSEAKLKEVYSGGNRNLIKSETESFFHLFQMTMMEVLWENLCTVLRAITCNRSSGSIEDQISSIGHLKILDEHYLPSSFGWSFSFIYERLNSSDLYVKINSTWNTRNTSFSKIIP